MALPDTNRYVPNTSLRHYPISNGMFQTQAYGITRYQPVCSKKQIYGITLISTGIFQKTSQRHYPDSSRYVPKTSLCHYLIPTVMFQAQVNGNTLIATSSN